MMFARKSPKKEIVIYKPDSKDQYFEVYVLEPKYIGSCRRIGSQRVQTENGEVFVNVNAAASYMLAQQGDQEMSSTLSPIMKRAAKSRASGLDLMTRGLWMQYCEMHNINPKDVTALTREYEFTPEEWKKLAYDMEMPQATDGE